LENWKKVNKMEIKRMEMIKMREIQRDRQIRQTEPMIQSKKKIKKLMKKIRNKINNNYLKLIKVNKVNNKKFNKANYLKKNKTLI
jgi:hypothetical protein